MSDPSRARVEAVFAEALERDGATRDAWLAERCAGDAALEDEVRSLLHHAETDAEFLETPAILCVGETDLPPDAHAQTAQAPARLGRYEILHVLGEGGMGVVYLARQDHPSRTVALKLLPPWNASPGARQRFEREAHLLGRLSHAGVAQIYEAGVADTPLGAQPYFAMEHVAGDTLLEHARRRALALDERLELLAEVCDAVQHAHERGVVHRDLKPSNVIVVEEAGKSRAKVLDFGIARALDDDGTDATGAGQVLGTLAYMSPEQASGARGSVDGRADVYALGVVGYELASGALPYDVAGASLSDALRTIFDAEPRPLRAVAPDVPPDVATILAKALEKDPARRYASAAALGADLRRFLAHEPIAARPHTRAYVAVKFVRRHRALVTGAALLLLVLVLGIAGTSWQAVRAARERDLANDARTRESESRLVAQRTAQRATSVLAYFLDTFTRAAPARPGETGPDVRMIDVIDRASASLPGRLATEPEAEADVLFTLARVYRSLGVLAPARTALERCRALRVEAFGEGAAETLRAEADLGAVALGEERLDEAAELLERALEGLTRTVGASDHDRVDCLEQSALLLVRRGRYAEAEGRLREALAIRARTDGERTAAWSTTANHLGMALMESGQLAGAHTLFERALAVGVERDGELHPSTLSKLSNLSSVLRLLGRPADALPYLERALAASRRVLGDRHPDTLTVFNNLAGAVDEQKHHARARDLYQEVFDLCTEVHGPEHGDTLVALGNLAHVNMQLGEFDVAEERFRECVERMSRALGDGDPRTLAARYNLASLLIVRGSYEEARELSVQVLETGRELLPPDHPNLALFAGNAGACELKLGRHADAEPMLLECFEILDRTLGAAHVRTRQAMQVLVGLYDAWEKPERAAEFRALLR